MLGSKTGFPRFGSISETYTCSMKHGFSVLMLCVATLILPQPADAQPYVLPCTNIRIGCHGFLISEHNQGLIFATMLGPVVDFNLLKISSALVIAPRCGLQLIHADDGASVGLPIELRVGVYDGNRVAFFAEIGLILQRGEAFFEEKSKIPVIGIDAQFMRPGRRFFWDLGVRRIVLPYYSYFNNQWTREDNRGGGLGIGFSLGWFLDDWGRKDTGR